MQGHSGPAIGINSPVAEELVVLDRATALGVRIVKGIVQRDAVKRHLLDTIDDLGRLDAGGLEDGRGDVDDVAVLGADLAVVFLVDANTLVLFTSDNGASGEGGLHGTFNENGFFNGVPNIPYEVNSQYINEWGNRVGTFSILQAIGLPWWQRRPAGDLLAKRRGPVDA